MPYSIPPSLGLDERGREAHVELPRAQADRERGEEVPGLVDEDQKSEAEDGDRDAQTGASLPSARRRAAASACYELGKIAHGVPIGTIERILDERRDLDETDALVEERRNGNLVRGVERAGIGPAALPRLAGERQERKALWIGRLELERERRREVEGRHGGRPPLGVRQRIRDRNAHVRVADVRERCAVPEANEAVDDRSRVHDDVDPLVRKIE